MQNFNAGVDADVDADTNANAEAWESSKPLTSTLLRRGNEVNGIFNLMMQVHAIPELSSGF